MTDSLAPVGDAIAEAPSPGGGGGVVRHVLVKLGGAVVSVAMVVVLGFLLFRVMPGDPVTLMTRGRPVTGEQLELLRRENGYDRPLWAQFVDYLGKLVRGDFGRSYAYNGPVGQIIGQRIWPTVLLVGTATVVAAVVGFWLGARTAWRRDGALDRGSTAAALVFWSIPPWFVGIVLMMLVGGAFPSGGMQSPDTPEAWFPHVLDVAHHMVLPVITLVLAYYGQYQLVMRASLLEEMNSLNSKRRTTKERRTRTGKR